MKTQLTANNTDPILANAADGGSPFAILQPDGFLIPFGEYPHRQGRQLFDQAAAEEILAAHNSALAKLARFVGGGSYPIYVGHPDLPGSKDADKRAYGWIENMHISTEGLHLAAKWSDAGRELVENAHFKFYSPLWWTRKVKGGIRPIALKSMGLTNDPNIPVPALANEQAADAADLIDEIETETENNTMKPDILAALGLDEGATPESVLAKITELTTAANEAARVAALETDLATATGKITELETAASAAAGLATTANERIGELEASVQAAVASAVESAIASGRVTAAEGEARRAEILAANDLATALQDLGKLPVVVKTASATGDLGTAKARLVIAANDEASAAREERARLVENEFQNTNHDLSPGARKRIAWERARHKHPEAFGDKKESSGTAA